MPNKNFSAKTFCNDKKIQEAKTTTFERCLNLKPHKTKVHLLKFMVNYFFLIFTRFAYQNDFFHSRSGHFTFGSDCTVFWAKKFFFMFVHLFKTCLTRIAQQLGAIRRTLLQKRQGKMKKERKKRIETFFGIFLCEKKWRLVAQVSRTSGHDSSASRTNSFAAQDDSRKCCFPQAAYKLHHTAFL